MNEIKTQTIYTEVPVSERLPEKKESDVKYVMTDEGIMWHQTQNGRWYYPGSSISKPFQPSFWLEKQENKIILSESELNEIKKKVAGDAFDAGGKRGYLLKAFGNTDAPTKEQYINNLFICRHENIDRKDGLDECLDCGAKNY